MSDEAVGGGSSLLHLDSHSIYLGSAGSEELMGGRG